MPIEGKNKQKWSPILLPEVERVRNPYGNRWPSFVGGRHRERTAFQSGYRSTVGNPNQGRSASVSLWLHRAPNGGAKLQHGAGHKPGTMLIEKEIKMKNFIAFAILPKAEAVRNHHGNRWSES